MNKLKSWLQKKLEKGFWFPCFQRALTFLHDRVSMGVCLGRWFENGGNPIAGVSELYQFVIFLIGIVWISLINHPPLSILASRPVQVIGIILALYPVTELLIFSLHWTFVASEPLVAIRRSLAAFLLNLFEIAIYFSIVFILAQCEQPEKLGWTAVYDSVKSIFNTELIVVADTRCCNLLAHYELVIAVILLAIVIASLVGGVLRKEGLKRAKKRC